MCELHYSMVCNLTSVCDVFVTSLSLSVEGGWCRSLRGSAEARYRRKEEIKSAGQTGLGQKQRVPSAN